MNYKTKGTCSMEISFDVVEDTVHNVHFVGGCNGNTQGVSKLVEGMKVDDVIDRLEGIKCGPRPTSCPDQLARALEEIKNGTFEELIRGLMGKPLDEIKELYNSREIEK